MLLDIAWPELMLVGVIALVVIGPKDLPRAMRVAGFWIRKARSLSREFQSSVDQMIREAELEEIREDLKKAGDIDIDQQIRNAVDPTGELEESLKPPEIPDHFEEEDFAAGHSEETTATAEEPAEPPLPLPVPEEAPEPEQQALPFDGSEHASTGDLAGEEPRTGSGGTPSHS